MRKSELDYIEVRSPEDVISAIQHLRDNPKLYQAVPLVLAKVRLNSQTVKPIIIN